MAAAGARLSRERLCQVLGQLAREDRAEHGRTEGATDRAEQRRARGRDTELAVWDGVLDCEHEHLHHEAETEAEHEHVGRGGRDARVGIHQREQVEPDHRHGGADDREDLVAATPRDQLPGSDRGDQQAAHHGQQLQAGLGWAGTVDDLEEERQVGDRAEQREPDDQPDQARRREDAVAEQPQRQHRLGSASLGEDEADERDGPDHAEPDDLRGSPGVGVAAERRQEHDRAQPGGEQACTEIVDRVAHTLGNRRQRQRKHDERRDAERDVDEEDPAP